MSLIRPGHGVPLSALLKRFVLIYLPIVLVLSVALLAGIRRDEQARVNEIEGNESSRIAVAEGLIMQDFSIVSAELRVIASLPLLRRYLDSGNPARRAELEAFFLVLSRGGQRYDQMRYLDASGQEVIRINYNDGQPAIVPREQLQNKSHRYYFSDTIKLNQGEIFVSPLDLNIEHGRVEFPHKPMIRFGTPVFDSAGRKQGVIMLNYFGRDLLQRFQDAMQGSNLHRTMLLNREGYWLSGAKPEDEWSFMLGKNERSFRHDFAEAWRTISTTEYGSLLTDQGLFVFAAVYPLIPGHRTYADPTLPHVHGQYELAANEYYWKIVSLVSHASLSGTALYNKPIGRVLQVVAYLLLALAAWVIALTTLQRKQAEEKINNLAFYDSLTQLPNRRLLIDRLHTIMATSKRSGRYGALMFLDLDNFKPLNDTHGHDVGDLLLVEASRRIALCVREMDTVARFGGDEFVVVLSELEAGQAESTLQARIIAEKIRATLDEPYVLKFQHEEKVETTIEHHCTVSIGIVLFVNHEANAEDILKWADRAMYQAKATGRNQIRFHDLKA